MFKDKGALIASFFMNKNSNIKQITVINISISNVK